MLQEKLDKLQKYVGNKVRITIIQDGNLVHYYGIIKTFSILKDKMILTYFEDSSLVVNMENILIEDEKNQWKYISEIV